MHRLFRFLSTGADGPRPRVGEPRDARWPRVGGRAFRRCLTGLITTGLAFAACAPDQQVTGEYRVDRQPDEIDVSAAGNGGSDDPPPVGGSSGGPGGLVDDPPPPTCGDLSVDDDQMEACDDGNLEAGDGCSANCLVIEDGYTCPQPGVPCVRAEVCGDSVIVGAETCDDGNADGGDGCAANCTVESDFVCPEPGELCVSSVVCGDSFVSGDEQCDDGNLTAGDGCSDACELEDGYACPLPGVRCSTVCGDGILTPPEQCDDGGVATLGCSEDCRLEVGFACDEPGEACRATVCGDGEKEGTEQCDDTDAGVVDQPYDGCFACVNEPRCGEVGGEYACTAVCGDGMKFPEEACDDGNTQNDDGCSSTCELELGYACTNLAADLGNALTLPIIYRDMSSTHPQFELDPLQSPRLAGMVEDDLGPDGKPEYNQAFTFAFQGQNRPWTMDGPGAVATGAATLTSGAQIAARFAEWFTDTPGQNTTIIDTLALDLQADESFQFSASLADTPPQQFFPLAIADESFADINGVQRNFHFTSEVRQWFDFQGGELLEFTGDDDVWVFVNGQLTVDLGGIHGEILGSIELSDDGDGSTLCLQDDVGGPVTCGEIDVPVSDGVNEIVVFQAERHVTQSNYTLTMQGFNAPITECESVCGDGVLTPDETCDDGPDGNGTDYGQCLTDLCIPGERCGDGEVNGPEECDNGINLDGYRNDDGDCAPGCLTPSFCGDGVVDARFGEQCDDGTEANDGAYGGCTPGCQLAPRCGDTVVDEPDETCDDGNRLNNDGCNVACQVEAEPT